jgi:ABC-type Zn uptake system ZnuABC Zn-binding protein ZnuA
MLADADLIVIADASLNSGLTQLAQLSGDRERILDLNKESLSERDFLYREGSSSWNPHTWTDPRMVEKWIPLIVERVSAVSPETREEVKARSESYATRIRALDEKIEKAFANLKPERRKLVVYHDAWEYFGRRYGLKVIGALQAVSFAEPSSAEIARMAEQVRRERVPAFFGSEVFPSDVLKALEAASGARYIPDLADDRLLGNVGDLEYGYIQLMESNLTLLLNGLAG